LGRIQYRILPSRTTRQTQYVDFQTLRSQVGEFEPGLGLINGKKGEMGRLEKKWGVDIELRELDYDSCIQQYQAGTVDAACLTNIDVLGPSLSQKSVAILPTSTATAPTP